MPGDDQQERGCGWNNHRGHGRYRSGCPYCAAVAGAEQATRQSARAEALRDAAEKLRERAQQATHYARHARLDDADFLVSLASDS